MDENSDKIDIIGALHDLRVAIDNTISTAQMVRTWNPHEVNPGDKTCVRELSLVITKLEEGKMWAGKALGAMGSELPKQYQDKAE